MEFITLEEIKNYLRVDFDDDDLLLTSFISFAIKLCMDISRCDNITDYSKSENAKISVMYAVAYLYENRENADYNKLNLSLRSLLFGIRKEVF